MRKCTLGVLLAVLILLSSFNCLSVLALKPKQHIGLGNGVLKQLQDLNGWVVIDGEQYKASALVYEAIKRFPSYYKMGLIGPDGFPDIVFGQGIVHPDSVGDADHYWGDGKSWSDDWLQALLSRVAADYNDHAQYDIHTFHNGYLPNPFEDTSCLKELAFTYGYITHAAGDMFGHTWVNRYVGGPWEWNDNAIRHIIVETYLGQKINKLLYPTDGGGTSYGIDYDRIFTGGETEQDEARDAFAKDGVFQEFLLDTFYRGSAADALVSGDGARTFTFRMIKTFVDLESSIDGWLDEFDKDFTDRAWWALPPHGWLVEGYLELWRYKINDFLLYWMEFQSKVAYEMFAENIFAGLSTIKEEVINKALTIPPTEGFVFKYVNAILPPNPVTDLAAFVGDVMSFITDLLWEKTGLKHLWNEMLDWATKQAIEMADDLVKSTFGVTLDQLKMIITDAATGEALQPSWLTKLAAENMPLDLDPHWERAPFGYNTKQMIDDELAFATPTLVSDPLDPGLFPEKFSVTYNIITIGKMILLPGCELNRLLSNHGYIGGPLYCSDPYSGYTYESLLEPGACVMLGFIKSLDGSYQWMPVAPTSGKLTSDGKSYGNGGMLLWQDVAARELVFKRIFHVGPQVRITSMKSTAHPGQTVLFTVTIYNYENQRDTIDVNVWAGGDGAGGFTNIGTVPHSFELEPLGGAWFIVEYVYNGPKSFVDAKLTVSATASAEAVARTLDPIQILSNLQSATMMVFSPGALQRQVDPDQPYYARDINLSLGRPGYFLQNWTVRFEYVTSLTPIYLYYVVNDTMELRPSKFEITFLNYPPGCTHDQEVARQVILGRFDTIAAVRGLEPVFLSDLRSDQKTEDGQYTVMITPWVLTGSGWHTLPPFTEWSVFLDNTPPSTALDLDQVWRPYRLPAFSGHSKDFSGPAFITPATTFTLEANETCNAISPDFITNYNEGPALAPIIGSSGVRNTFYCVEKQAETYVVQGAPVRLLGGGRFGYAMPYSVPAMRRITYTEVAVPWTSYTEPFHLQLTQGNYSLVYYSVDNIGNVETKQRFNFSVVDPPKTSLAVGEPHAAAWSQRARAYVTGSTPLSLSVSSDAGVYDTYYRIWGGSLTKDESFIHYTGGTFTLDGLADGPYAIEYYSTDNTGNEEEHHAEILIIDPMRAMMPQVYVDVHPVRTAMANFVKPETPFTLTALGNASALTTITYRVHNLIYDSGWIGYGGPFNLTGLLPGNYTVEIRGVDESGNVSNDEVTVLLKAIADINYDGKVDIRDIAAVAWCFGATGPNYPQHGSPPSTKWDLYCDMNGDNKIDVRDLVLIARNFGKVYL